METKNGAKREWILDFHLPDDQNKQLFANKFAISTYKGMMCQCLNHFLKLTHKPWLPPEKVHYLKNTGEYLKWWWYFISSEMIPPDSCLQRSLDMSHRGNTKFKSTWLFFFSDSFTSVWMLTLQSAKLYKVNYKTFPQIIRLDGISLPVYNISLMKAALQHQLSFVYTSPRRASSLSLD